MISKTIDNIINKLNNNEPLNDNDKQVIIETLQARKLNVNKSNNNYKNNRDKLLKQQLNYYHNVVKKDKDKMERKRAYNREYNKRKYQEKKRGK